ncbi:MAG: TonB family protein [Chitinophagaceae bacterium]|nr:TonB family protein [Chitinophagaceae bacterium]
MNSNTILQTGLLDILFHNRNKDYGAYVLRKEYNKRMLQSLLGMLGLVLMFVVWQIFDGGKKMNIIPLVAYNPDTVIIAPPPYIKPPVIPVEFAQHSSNAHIQNPPVIVIDAQADKPSLEIPVPETPGIDNGTPAHIPGSDKTTVAGTGNTRDIVVPVKPFGDKSKPTFSAQVMPQYQGGVDAMLRFLKQNLRSPRDLDEGEEISVKINFIVNIDGDLTGFNVVESGGENFNNEVIRVLKKMPRWIPGKNEGENVSVYYTVPVKFTSEQ